MKKLLKILLWIIIALIIIAAVYVAYVFISYDRIEDNLALAPVSSSFDEAAVLPDREYTIVTQNIGFGAYTPDFTFFMDGGVVMKFILK